jgi:hypothetical protein
MLKNSPILLVSVIALAVLAPGASAATWCLNSSTCGAGGNNFPMTQNGLEQAISGAQANPGFDRIEIGAGTIDLDTKVSATSTASNPLFIEGVGNGNSFIRSSIAQGDVLAITATGSGSDAIKDIKFKLDGTATGTRTALHLTGATASAIGFEVTGSGDGYASVGLAADSDTTCDYCDFRISGDDATGAFTAYGATFLASTFTNIGPATAVTTGIRASGGTTLVRSSRITGFRTAASNDLGTLNISDSLIDLGAAVNAIGVTIENRNGGSSELAGNLNGVTIYGTGNGQTGFRIYGEATQSVTSSIKNSLLMLTGGSSIAAQCDHQGSSTTVLDLLFVMLNGGAASKNAGCTGNTGLTWDSSHESPSAVFLDAAAGDFRLRPLASVIDRGDLAEPTSSHFADAALANRFVDGSGGGVATIDLGAYEYQNYAPNKPQISVSPTTVAAGVPVHFSASTTDDNGDPLTWSWDFHDGSYADTASGDHVFTQPGTYSVAVRASDNQGASSEESSVLVTVNTAPPPSSGDPAAPLPFQLTLAKQTGKAAVKKMLGAPKIGEATARATGQLPITASAAVDVQITLLRARAGFLVAGKCKARPGASGKAKSCDLAVGGVRSFSIPAGRSQFTLGRKWGRYRLTPGTYRIVVRTSRLKDSLKSTLNVVR